MTTERCYRCGERLPGYFSQLCGKCRAIPVEQEEDDDDDRLFDERDPAPGSYDGWQDDWKR